MTETGPRSGVVYVPLAGDLDHGIAKIRVIDWGQPAANGPLALTGPTAHGLGKDAEIDATLRTERLHGRCRATSGDGQLMVELLVADGRQITGLSYTLGLVLAAQMARGCLPRLATHKVIASGRVERDGSIGRVGRIGGKLAAIRVALDDGLLRAPVLVLSRGNLESLTAEEQVALEVLAGRGLRCVGLAHVAELTPAWPPGLESISAPGLPPRSVGRTWLAAGAALVALALAVSVTRPAPPMRLSCARLAPDAATLDRCWQPLPMEVKAACRRAYQGGWRPWRQCPTGTCLAVGDQFRLELTPGADGWLSVFHLDDAERVVEDLRPGRALWRVRAGDTLVLPRPGRTWRIDGRADQERFLTLLTRRPLPALEGPLDADRAGLLGWLGARAEALVFCREPTPAGE